MCPDLYFTGLESEIQKRLGLGLGLSAYILSSERPPGPTHLI